MRVLLLAIAAFITSLVGAYQIEITGFTGNTFCSQDGPEGDMWYTWTVDSGDLGCYSFVNSNGLQQPMQSLAYKLPLGAWQQPLVSFYYTTGSLPGPAQWHCEVNSQTVVTTDYLNAGQQDGPGDAYWMCISPKSSNQWTSFNADSWPMGRKQR
jgi:hypothetical protein